MTVYNYRSDSSFSDIDSAFEYLSASRDGENDALLKDEKTDAGAPSSGDFDEQKGGQTQHHRTCNRLWSPCMVMRGCLTTARY